MSGFLALTQQWLLGLRQKHLQESCAQQADCSRRYPPLISNLTPTCAGHETTAAVCTWTLFCLLQNEAAEAKILAEIDAVVGDRVPSEWGRAATGAALMSLASKWLYEPGQQVLSAPSHPPP